MDLDYSYSRFGYVPHRGQKKIHEAARKFRKLCVLFGRRGGKSHCASFEGCLGLLEKPHSIFGAPCCLITAPTADLTKAVFEKTHDMIFQHLKDYSPFYSRSEKYIRLRKLGSMLYVRSGDKPKSLVSRGYSSVIVDESGFFRDDAFRELEPALLEREGRLIAIGVPALKNWYYDLYKEIKRGGDGFIIQLPSIVNPSVSVKEFKALFKKLALREFLRQYCGKFIEDEMQVWKNKDLENCILENVGLQNENFEFVAGVDFARKQDYTVVTILKLSNPLEVVDSLRLHGGSWTDQIQQIDKFLRQWNVQVATVDATGIGDAVQEQLINNTPVAIAPFVFTNESKSQVIDSLTLLLEKGKIKIPSQFDGYHKEMRAYEYSVSKTGLRVFNAPEGYNDDYVISLALAVRAAQYDYISGFDYA